MQSNVAAIKKFYRKIVKKINSFGSIRTANTRFLDERRKILQMKMNPDKKIDEFFECCKLNVAYLECIRLKNFEAIKQNLIKRIQNKEPYQSFV